MALEEKKRFHDSTADELLSELVSVLFPGTPNVPRTFWWLFLMISATKRALLSISKRVEWRNSMVFFVDYTEGFARRAVTSIRSRHTLQLERLSDATLPSIFSVHSISSKLSNLRSTMYLTWWNNQRFQCSVSEHRDQRQQRRYRTTIQESQVGLTPIDRWKKAVFYTQ